MPEHGEVNGKAKDSQKDIEVTVYYRDTDQYVGYKASVRAAGVTMLMVPLTVENVRSLRGAQDWGISTSVTVFDLIHEAVEETDCQVFEMVEA